MPGLTATMWMAAQSLLANQAALDVTSNNIANASTPGYSREQAVLTEGVPVQDGNINYGSGVVLQQVRSIRDQVLEFRIAQEMQQQGSAQAQYNALQQVQALFSNSTQGIAANFTAFFNSLNQLSTDPTNIPQRQAVLTAARNLASSFQQTEANLNTIRSGLDQSVAQTVSQVNSLTQQIAKLNEQVGEMQRLGQDPGVLMDQENSLIHQLSQLTDVSLIQTEQGLSITTGNGTALVVGGQSFALQASPNSAGIQHIYSQGQDITGTFKGGQLAGTLQVRDQAIPGLLSQIDDLASQFASAVNGAQQNGYDLNGAQGQALFSFTSGAGAASTLTVAISDPNLIAASSDGSPGSNGNLANLTAVGTQALPSGSNPVDTYANLVAQAGDSTLQAKAEVNASTVSLNQLNDQRGAISGVSIDEETTNLITYQRAYQAAARVVTTVDQLMQTVLQMGA
ncbi:MAG: flagellar hook-associated protein FlgK [Acidobacteriia bacterium]|nr:flagellar hook-associated protein FlgK [Terriglobia bacterium]